MKQFIFFIALIMMSVFCHAQQQTQTIKDYATVAALRTSRVIPKKTDKVFVRETNNLYYYDYNAVLPIDDGWSTIIQTISQNSKTWKCVTCLEYKCINQSTLNIPYNHTPSNAQIQSYAASIGMKNGIINFYNIEGINAATSLMPYVEMSGDEVDIVSIIINGTEIISNPLGIKKTGLYLGAGAIPQVLINNMPSGITYNADDADLLASGNYTVTSISDGTNVVPHLTIETTSKYGNVADNSYYTDYSDNYSMGPPIGTCQQPMISYLIIGTNAIAIH